MKSFTYSLLAASAAATAVNLDFAAEGTVTLASATALIGQIKSATAKYTFTTTTATKQFSVVMELDTVTTGTFTHSTTDSTSGLMCIKSKAVMQQLKCFDFLSATSADNVLTITSSIWQSDAATTTIVNSKCLLTNSNNIRSAACLGEAGTIFTNKAQFKKASVSASSSSVTLDTAENNGESPAAASTAAMAVAVGFTAMPVFVYNVSSSDK